MKIKYNLTKSYFFKFFDIQKLQQIYYLKDSVKNVLKYILHYVKIVKCWKKCVQNCLLLNTDKLLFLKYLDLYRSNIIILNIVHNDVHNNSIKFLISYRFIRTHYKPNFTFKSILNVVYCVF